MHTHPSWKVSGRRLPLRSLAATLAVVLVAAGSAAAPAAAAGQPVAVTWSSEDGTHRLSPRPAKTLTATMPPGVDATVTIDPQVRGQVVFGQGGVLESSSVWNLVHLPAATRDRVMRQLFDPVDGNGYNLVRLAMGCPDMCAEGFYTYDDRPAGQTDPTLQHFSIQRDIDAGILALARQARAINPDVRFYLSMWSAPAWMKSNESLINGGRVRPEYYPVLARYQRRAIQAYQAQGIPIHAMTPQNEPLVVMPYPTGSWTGEEMRSYVRDHLGPELVRSGVGTEIWIGDDNPPSLRDFVPTILDDPAAAQYVRGVAIHDYTSDDPAVLQDFRIRYPAMPLHLTERSYYGINGERHKVSGGWQAGVRRLIDFYRNGVASWTYWITFLDTAGEPNTGPLDASCCSVQFTAPPGDLAAVQTQRDHYLYGQLTRWVRHGAERIGSDQTSTEVSNVVFRNPDGSMVAVVANGAAAPRSVALRTPDGVIADTLPAMTVATYRWTGGSVPADARLGQFRLVNRAFPDRALHGTGDLYQPWTDAYQVAASPIGWNSAEQHWTISSAGDGRYRLTSLARQRTVLHTAGETYRSFPDVWRVAGTRADLGWDEQLWRIEPTGDGYYRLLNVKRGTALQATGDGYGGFVDVVHVVGSPADWNLVEQQWRLVPG